MHQLQLLKYYLTTNGSDTQRLFFFYPYNNRYWKKITLPKFAGISQKQPLVSQCFTDAPDSQMKPARPKTTRLPFKIKFSSYPSTRCTQGAIRRHSHCVQVATVTIVVGLQLAVGQVPDLRRGGSPQWKYYPSLLWCWALWVVPSSVNNASEKCQVIHANTFKSSGKIRETINIVKQNVPSQSCPNYRRQWWGCCCWERSAHKKPTHRGRRPAEKGT